jgi:hypothetical protein
MIRSSSLRHKISFLGVGVNAFLTADQGAAAAELLQVMASICRVTGCNLANYYHSCNTPTSRPRPFACAFANMASLSPVFVKRDTVIEILFVVCVHSLSSTMDYNCIRLPLETSETEEEKPYRIPELQLFSLILR